MEFQDYGILSIQNFKNLEISELWNFSNQELYDPGITVFQTYRILERIKYF